MVERVLVVPARARALPARGRARRRQDARRSRRSPASSAARSPASSSPPTWCPSDIVGTRDLPARPRDVRRRARPGVRQLRARRRDQPRAGQGAVGAARGDGRAARVDRRQDLRRARAVPRARHPEPDRVRGRLPAARGAARPVPHEGRRSATRRAARGAARSSAAWASTRRTPSRCSDSTSCCGCSRSPPTGLRPPRGRRLRGPAGARDPGPGRARHRRRSPACSPTARSPRASLGLDRRRPGARAAARAATTCCPQDVVDVAARRAARTGSSCPTRRSPTACRRRVSSAEMLRRVPQPPVGPTSRAGGRPVADAGIRPAWPRPAAPADDGPAAARPRASTGAADPEQVEARAPATSSCLVLRRLEGLLQGNHLGLVPGPGSELRRAASTASATTSGGWTGR